MILKFIRLGNQKVVRAYIVEDCKKVPCSGHGENNVWVANYCIY